jgi:zinc transport system ATP-binding protein
VFLKALLGLLVPDRGTVRLLGAAPQEARSSVGYVSQHAAFDRDFPINVLQVVMMSALGRGRMFRRHGAEDRDRALAALERLEIAQLADRQIGKLSGGQLQRVLVARALAVDARLMLLDEPASSLDSRIDAELHELLAGLVPEMTVVLVSHDLGVISRHVDAVAYLNRRMQYFDSSEITREMIEATYGHPVDLVMHRYPRQVPPARTEGD